MAVSVVVARVACGKLFDLVSRRALMIPAVALTIAALLLLLLAQTEWSLLASGILYGLSGAFAMPVLSAEVVRRAPETRWGAGNAMLWLSMDIGVGFGVLILGAIIDNFGFEAMIGASILILLATTIIVLRVFPAKAR
jgi:predicted MFS family arabinose efflux permease